jgi:hypothetical protein
MKSTAAGGFRFDGLFAKKTYAFPQYSMSKAQASLPTFRCTCLTRCANNVNCHSVTIIDNYGRLYCYGHNFIAASQQTKAVTYRSGLIGCHSGFLSLNISPLNRELVCTSRLIDLYISFLDAYTILKIVNQKRQNKYYVESESESRTQLGMKVILRGPTNQS